MWDEVIKFCGIPSDAARKEVGDELTVTWESRADRLLSPNGPLAKHMPGFESRKSQLYAMRAAQRSIEMHMPLLMQAGTGTGKTMIYLLMAMDMGLKIAVSAPTIALQQQLTEKDIPLVIKMFPGKTAALAIGKGRYVCLDKVMDGSLEFKAPTAEAARWLDETKTGNSEEAPFAFTKEMRDEMLIDDGCSGRMCQFYNECFYYREKRKHEDADIVVCNHALLAISILYESVSVLPANRQLIVVDEAHTFPDAVASALEIELKAQTFADAVRVATRYSFDITGGTDTITRLGDQFKLFAAEIEAQTATANEKDREIGISTFKEFDAGESVAATLKRIAHEIWPEADTPSDREEAKVKREAARLRNLAHKIVAFSGETQPGSVRFIRRDTLTKANTAILAQFDVSKHIGRMCGFIQPQEKDQSICANCAKPLNLNAKLATLNGNAYCGSCIESIDLSNEVEYYDVAEWTKIKSEAPKYEKDTLAIPVIFTSATLGVPKMDLFRYTCGIKEALEINVKSNFDYASNMQIYLPSADCPTPGNGNAAAHTEWATEKIQELVSASHGGAFLLFTSDYEMKKAWEALHYNFEAEGLLCLKQNDMPRTELVRKFKEDGNAVLFGLRTFMEGVDIKGQALRLVVLNKIPFDAPNPLMNAMEAAMNKRAEAAGVKGKTLEFYAFNNMRIPRAIAVLLQAVGRLIRSMDDYGTVAILDPRVRGAFYGRRDIIPALPNGKIVELIEEVEIFFASRSYVVITRDEIVDYPGMPNKRKSVFEYDAADLVNAEELAF